MKSFQFMSMRTLITKMHGLAMYSYLNRKLWDGTLTELIGFPFRNRIINRHVLKFGRPDYWKIDRHSFEVDMPISLTFDTDNGPRIWSGYFNLLYRIENDGIDGMIVDCYAKDDLPPRDDSKPLTKYLTPVCSGTDLDVIAEEIWRTYYPDGIPSADQRDAQDLARRMGLQIVYEPIYKDDGVGSILFFGEGELWIKDKKDKSHTEPERITIPGNTIVVNTNIIKQEYSQFDIYHECFHYWLHYPFYVLQKMKNNDLRGMEEEEIVIDEKTKVTNPIYWVENQANRGAYGLLMPSTETTVRIHEALASVDRYMHQGDLYQQAGEMLAHQLKLPHFRIRARMIQLGHIHARGALNYVDRQMIEPFDFDIDSWERDECTFVIDRSHSSTLFQQNEDYRRLLCTDRYVYADGHIVINQPQFVKWEGDRHMLTPWAYAHVDYCCLRFEREYQLKHIGRYTPGRLNYDAAYVQRMEFYLQDTINSKQLALEDAQVAYVRTFPETFKEAFHMLRRQNNMSMEDFEEISRVPLSTLKRRLDDPEGKVTIDFIMFICLTWKLPDFIANLLFDRAGKHLSLTNKRHLVFMHILRVEWEDGVEKANEHLRARDLEPISI